MKSHYVHIDYSAIARALSLHIRKKAAESNSTIVYMKGGSIIEEDPKNSKQTILKNSSSK